jgi:hypothetical protein
MMAWLTAQIKLIYEDTKSLRHCSGGRRRPFGTLLPSFVRWLSSMSHNVEPRKVQHRTDHLNLPQFKTQFVRQGIEGGKRAAYALRSTIANECGELANDVEVITKVYANLTGLGKAMRKDGSVENENDVKQFSIGFSQAMASFDYVDVGHGKERADSKIRGMPAGPSSVFEDVADQVTCQKSQNGTSETSIASKLS